ncbi:MAG: cysteine dioxygenase family protein [Planctomycetota bacterium]
MTRRLDAALELPSTEDRCAEVSRAIQTFVAAGERLDAEWLQPGPTSYGRRLLHRHPEGRYTVVVMTWASGQGTPIHDHAGLWCVECVYQGSIQVSSFRLVDESEDGAVRFERESQITAGVGAAGALIPPFDYHVIENPFAEVAATIHVYGGEMEQCAVFEPTADGRYRRCARALAYSSAE